MRTSLEPAVAAGPMVERMKALGDPIRWSVVRLLSHGERCVCDIESEIGIAQSRLSYHLGILREAGIISDRRSGRWIYYSLNPGALEEAIDMLRTETDMWMNEGRYRVGSKC